MILRESVVLPSFPRIPLSITTVRRSTLSIRQAMRISAARLSVLKMVNGVILVVDAYEGVMPADEVCSAQGAGTGPLRCSLYQ